MKWTRVLKAEMDKTKLINILKQENNGKEMFFADLVKQNGDILWPVHTPIPLEYKDLPTQSVFDYSIEHGGKKGTVDSFRYYNNYIVILQ